MKKVAICMFVLLPFILCSGCTQTSKTLARNLDSTISSLVYCVSSLDLLDNTQLNNVNFITNSLNKNINSVISASADINIDIDAENNKTINDNADDENDKNSIFLTEKDEILDNKNNENDINTDIENNNLNKEKSANLIDENKNIGKILNNKDHFAENLHNNNCDKKVLNSQNLTPDTIKDYASGISISNSTPSTTDTTYGDIYTSLESSSKRIEKLIVDLSNIRSVVMLYISDLYNGSISLSAQDIESINSYLNIVKEATAYLKANIGSVKNHINEANDLTKNNKSISLANSHIIRATETLNTRCAKLESAIVATYNIADTIKNSINNTQSTNNNSFGQYGGNNLSQTEETNAAPLENFNFFSGSPNYAMNNPINTGVNGMRYMPNGYDYGGYNMGLGYYGGYGYNPYMGGYPMGFGYNNYGANYSYAPYNYGYNYNNSGGYSPFIGGYGNNCMGGGAGYDGINNYCYNGYGFSGTTDNNIGVPNNIVENNAFNNSTVLPNVLTGLVSNDNQESLKEKQEEGITKEKQSAKISSSNAKITTGLAPQKINHGVVPKRLCYDTPKLQKAQNMA